MLGHLSLDIICSSKVTVFLELRSRKTVRFSEQIMSADKYPSIFSRQMETIVYISRNFQNCARCEKDLKDNKDNVLHLGRKYVRIFVLGHYLFLVAHSFPRALAIHIINPVDKIKSTCYLFFPRYIHEPS